MFLKQQGVEILQDIEFTCHGKLKITIENKETVSTLTI